MPAYNINGDLLRKDLMDYYGTAAFNGFPCAIMDVFAVERMSSEQLWAQGVKNGFTMDRYTENAAPKLTTRDLASFVAQHRQYNSKAYPYQSSATAGPTEDQLRFPTYEKSVNNSFFILTETAQNIIKYKPAFWERLLLAQEIQDFSYQLGKLKKQTPENPYVKTICTASEGRPLLYYIVSFSNNLSQGIEKSGSIINTIISDLNWFFTKRQDISVIQEKAFSLMEPFKIFLGLYNDISLVDIPSEYNIIYSEFRKVLKSLMSDCGMFYYELANELTNSAKQGIPFQNESSMQLHGFYTKKISDAVLQNARQLQECKIRRKLI